MVLAMTLSDPNIVMKPETYDIGDGINAWKSLVPSENTIDKFENRFRCVNSTPFGKPVVPDEHKTTATLSAMFCGWHSNVFTFVSATSGSDKKLANDLHRASSPPMIINSFSIVISSTIFWTLSTVDDDTKRIFGCNSLQVWLSSPEFD